MSVSAADKLEIHELVSRYNRAVDGGDARSWVETFTEQGTFESLLVGTYQGHQELLEFAEAFSRDSQYSKWTGGQHWIGNIIIEGDAQRAEVFSYHIMFVPEQSIVSGVLMAAHEDVVVKTEDGWRFERRRLIPWPPDSDPARWDTDHERDEP